MTKFMPLQTCFQWLPRRWVVSCEREGKLFAQFPIGGLRKETLPLVSGVSPRCVTAAERRWMSWEDKTKLLT